MKRRIRPSPIKTQGRKSKLVSWLSLNIDWFSGEGGRWIEPFMGSCQVGMTFAPAHKALMCDDNPHLVELCRGMRDGIIGSESMAALLAREGKLFRTIGHTHYQTIRDRFNRDHDPHDLLLLNHSCYNGLMRWNSSGRFNAPYGKNDCKLTETFARTLCQNVRLFSLNSQKWTFKCQDWKKTVSAAKPGDFVYMDPPYEGLDTTYYSKWKNGGMEDLCAAALALPCSWAVSSWSKSGGMENHAIGPFRDAGCRIIPRAHKYVIGHGEPRGNAVTECLVLSP